MRRVCIVGGGHAGSSAALAAASLCHRLAVHDIEVQLIIPSPYLGIRPRYYEYELEETQVPLADFLQPLCVKLKYAAVTHIDTDAQQLTCDDGDMVAFDALVVAAGSRLSMPPIPGIELAHNIDTYTAAMALRDALEETYVARIGQQQPCCLAILGAGITGLELACELPVWCRKIAEKNQLPMVAPTVYLLDRHQVRDSLGGDTSVHVQAALAQSGVIAIDQATVTAVRSGEVAYNTEKTLAVDMSISTLGLQAHPLGQQLAENLDPLGRVPVNQYLQLPTQSNIYVAGDLALVSVDENHGSVMSCQQGRPQGRYAGYNAVANLVGKLSLAYAQRNYVTCVDLGEWGGIYTEGWVRKTQKIGLVAKTLKRHINQDRIYPPLGGDLSALLAAGAPEFAAPTQTQTQSGT